MESVNLVRNACRAAGIDPSEVTALRVHSNAVFLLPAENLIARVGRGADAVGRAARSVEVTRWLHEYGYPCVMPATGIVQPVIVDGIPVTFWSRVVVADDADPVTGSQLGHLLRQLHRMRPPFALPRFRPLDRLAAALTADTWLPPEARGWLEGEVTRLQYDLETLQFPGGHGMVHGDAQLDNVLAGLTGPIVGDWDNVADAPYAWDLVPAQVEQRFGGPPALLAEVLTAYGTDPTGDPGWTCLCDVYELRSIAAHMRQAPSSPEHAREARLRISSLQSGDRRIRWHGVG